MQTNSINRRDFLESSAKNAAGVAAGMAAGMVSLAGATTARADANERVGVGVIGVRGQGRILAGTLSQMGDLDVVSLCDVDESLLAPASKEVETVSGRSPRCERDFRRLLDDPAIHAVVIATPDHWHAVMATLACQAGKDVYLETPVSHSLEEGTALVRCARDTRRIVASGLQQRSGSQFQSAIEFLRGGRLGTVHLAKAWAVHQRKPIGTQRELPAPAGVDHDLWLGPAPERGFQSNRFHHNWRWFWDYGSGELGNWGVHLLDVARWGLDVGLPVEVSASGGKYHFVDDQETPDTLFVQYRYPGKSITWEHRLWSAQPQEGRSAAVAFYGDRGTLIVDRGGWKVYGQNEAQASGSGDLLTAHLRNFIDCVKTRQQPACSIATGHESAALCHLGNQAYRLGRTLQIDPATGTFDTANTDSVQLRREYRAPWKLV